MTVEQLRRTLHASPFQPFTIRMAYGRKFPIPHPDFLALSPTGRTAAIYDSEGLASIVDLLLMTELELTPSPAPHA
jgi:hypothetical protein